MGTVLITGSNGFIGSHVASYFKDKGWNVVGLGRKTDASNPEVVDDYISCCLGNASATDVLESELGNMSIDAIVHLAADMRKEPYAEEVIIANCVGTQQLLEFAEKHQVSVFLQLSSLPVIGVPKIHPITEDHPVMPQTMYHITKCMNELQLQYAMQHYQIRTAWFRISAPLGIGMNENTIFPTFIKNALLGIDLSVYGEGSRKQNYIYVKDIARALYMATIIQSAQGGYNLTGNLLISNLDLAKRCIGLLDSTSDIKFMPFPDNSDGQVWDADMSRSSTDFGFEPHATLDEIIYKFAQYFRKEKGLHSEK